MPKRAISTKIIATIGPEMQLICDHDKIRPVDLDTRLCEFSRRGVDVFRINMAFYRTKRDRGVIPKLIVPALKRITNRHIAIMGDVGPKIRVTGPTKPMELQDGNIELNFKGRPVMEERNRRFSAVLYGKPYPGLSGCVEQALKHGDVIIAIGEDDVILSAKETDFDPRKGVLNCTVTRGGEFKNGKGLTFRNVDVEFPRYLTQDVRDQIDYLIESCGDLLAFLALSFVQSADDILEARSYVQKKFLDKRRNELSKLGYLDPRTGRPLSVREVASFCSPMIVAKIETARAISKIEEIALAADCIMIARGDLGLQIGAARFPAEQKKIIKMCNLLGKTVITATQMLKSMTLHPTPLRAESTDVFNAIVDGSDSIMLSDETCDGPYPYQAIESAVDIAIEAERFCRTVDTWQARYERFLGESLKLSRRMRGDISRRLKGMKGVQRKYWSDVLTILKMQEITDRVTESACTLSDCRGVTAIVAPTTTGRTVQMISRFRPGRVAIIGAAHDKYNERKLIIGYGVRPMNIETGFKSSSAVADAAVHKAVTMKYIRRGDRVVVTAGWPLFSPGTTNIVMIQTAS